MIKWKPKDVSDAFEKAMNQQAPIGQRPDVLQALVDKAKIKRQPDEVEPTV